MARPRKDAPIDLSEAQELTAGLIERLTCRIDIKAQAFLRDSIAPGLRVRVSNTGAKAFVFEAKLNRHPFGAPLAMCGPGPSTRPARK